MTQKTVKTSVPKFKKKPKRFCSKTTDHCSPEETGLRVSYERLEEVTRMQPEKKFSSYIIVSGTTPQKLKTLALFPVPNSAGHA